MADGSVKIDVGLNIGKAEKELVKLKEKIEKTEDALNSESNKRNGLEQQIAAANAQLDEAKKRAVEVQVELQKESAAADAKLDEAKATVNEIRTEMAGARGSAKAEIRERLNTALDDQRMYQAEADRLAKETAKATEELSTGTKEVRETQKEIDKLNKELDKTNAKIEQGEKNLNDMKEEAGQLTQQIERARPGEAIASSLESAKRSLTKFLKYAIGIRSVYILFQRLKQSIKSAVQEYAEYDKELKYNLALLSATKKAIQITNGAAFASVFNAILPIVQRIANWMLEAANAASRFIAILSGKSSYKRAVVNAEEVAASLEEAEDDTEDTADAADDVADGFKEAKKQVLGFDELNILDSDKDEKTTKDPKEKIKDAEKAALDGIDIIEESIDGLDESFLDKLALTMKDVLFDWKDLNPEQIAEKFIAGLGALLGAALGIALGMGPGGVLLMTLAGLALGLIADSLIFDHDGKISSAEASKMITMAVMGLLGFIAGFALTGSLAGGFIGTIIGAALALKFHDLIFGTKGMKFNKTAFKNNLFLVLNSMIGGVAGFALTGGSAIGAGIGLVVGFALTMLIETIKPKMGAKGADITEKILRFLTIAAGGVIGFTLGSVIPGLGNLAGAVVGLLVATLAVVLSSIFLKDDPNTTEMETSIAALKERIENSMELDVNIKAHIDSITGEVDESTLAELSAAQALLDKIFTLDAKESKTSEEIAEIKANIDALNGMHLSGVLVEFNDATGYVNGTHEAMQLVLDDLLRQYQYQAMADAYIESYKAQYEAVTAMKDAEKNRQEASEANSRATDEVTRAQDEYNAALEEYNTLRNSAWKDRGDDYSEQLAAAADRLEKASNAIDEAKRGAEATQEMLDNAQADLEAKIGFAEQAAAKVSEIGAAFEQTAKQSAQAGTDTGEGFAGNLEATTPQAVAAAIDQAKRTLEEGYQQTLDTGSPSKETQKIGAWTSEGFKNGIEEGTDDVVAAAKDSATKTVDAFQEGANSALSVVERMRTDIRAVFQNIVHEIAENLQQMRNLMNFTWSIPRPKIPKINWTIKNVSYGNGQSVSIPEFFVNWYAKGGVFDFPQLIGVGEAGKEAVVPLERNTEWMDMVADGLMERFERANFANDLADAFTKLPKPALAGGGIVPPNSVGGTSINQESMQQAIERGVYNAIMALGGMPKSRGGLIMNVNGKEFARATYNDMQAVKNEHGISLIEG